MRSEAGKIQNKAGPLLSNYKRKYPISARNYLNHLSDYFVVRNI